MIVICATVIQQVMGDAYTTPGTYSVMIPANTAEVIVSMWGAGGAGTSVTNTQSSSNALMYPGGSGAYVSCSVNAPAGSTITLIVGVVELLLDLIKKLPMRLAEEAIQPSDLFIVTILLFLMAFKYRSRYYYQ